MSLSFHEDANMNISSALVHVHPVHTCAVEQSLVALPGVEVHGISPEGKMIITIESADEDSTLETFTRIGQLEHVLAVAMTYNQSESEPEKEI